MLGVPWCLDKSRTMSAEVSTQDSRLLGVLQMLMCGRMCYQILPSWKCLNVAWQGKEMFTSGMISYME